MMMAGQEFARDAELKSDGWSLRDPKGHMAQVGPLWAKRVDEEWRYGVVVTQRSLNLAGVAHGGMLLTLLDHALSTIAWETSGRRDCLTVQLNANFLRAGKLGEFIVGSGNVVRQTRNLIFMNGRVCADDHELMSGQAIVKVISRDVEATGDNR